MIMSKSFLQEAPADQLIPLPSGARGGRLVLIPPTPEGAGNNKNVHVSQSVSVSKVSVKMGGISSAGIQQQQQLRHELLSEISDIYEDPELSNSLPLAQSADWVQQTLQPEFRRLDIVGPLAQPHNSLGYDEHKLR
jgi:hypothetical protein